MAGRSGLAAAAACTAAAAALVPVPAAASQASFLRETGCRNVVDGAAWYERDRVVDGLPVADSDYPGALKRDSGRLVAVLRLAAPACPEVEHLLRVHRPDGSVLLDRAVAGVSGTDQVEFDVRVRSHDQDCLAVQLATQVRGVVVDLAPDVLESYETVCDREVGEVPYR